MKLSYAQRVANGATLLDSKEPGWAGTVNLDTLDIVDVFVCVLGQVFGSYIRGLDVLADVPDFNNMSAADHGFSLYDWEAFEDYDDRSEADALFEAWQDEILDRTED